MVRPVPIPNTAVKHCRADGSSLIDSARVGRRHSFLKAGTEMFRLFYLFLLPITLTTFPNHPLPHKLLNPSTHSSHLSITKKIGREFSLPFRAPHSKAAALLPIPKLDLHRHELKKARMNTQAHESETGETKSVSSNRPHSPRPQCGAGSPLWA